MKDRELENSLLYLGNFPAKYEISSKYRFQKWHNTKVQIPKLTLEKGRKTGYELVKPTDTTLQEGAESWWTTTAKKRRGGKAASTEIHLIVCQSHQHDLLAQSNTK